MGRHFRIFWRGDIYVYIYIYTRRKKDVERRGKEKKEGKKRRKKKKSTSLGSFLEWMPRRKAISGVISDTNGSILPLPGPLLRAKISVHRWKYITDGKTVQGNCKTVPDSPVCVMQFIWIFFFFFLWIVVPSFLPSLPRQIADSSKKTARPELERKRERENRRGWEGGRERIRERKREKRAPFSVRIERASKVRPAS